MSALGSVVPLINLILLPPPVPPPSTTVTLNVSSSTIVFSVSSIMAYDEDINPAVTKASRNASTEAANVVKSVPSAFATKAEGVSPTVCVPES